MGKVSTYQSKRVIKTQCRPRTGRGSNNIPGNIMAQVPGSLIIKSENRLTQVSGSCVRENRDKLTQTSVVRVEKDYSEDLDQTDPSVRW